MVVRHCDDTGRPFPPCGSCGNSSPRGPTAGSPYAESTSSAPFIRRLICSNAFSLCVCCSTKFCRLTSANPWNRIISAGPLPLFTIARLIPVLFIANVVPDPLRPIVFDTVFWVRERTPTRAVARSDGSESSLLPGLAYKSLERTSVLIRFPRFSFLISELFLLFLLIS